MTGERDRAIAKAKAGYRLTVARTSAERSWESDIATSFYEIISELASPPYADGYCDGVRDQLDEAPLELAKAQ